MIYLLSEVMATCLTEFEWTFSKDWTRCLVWISKTLIDPSDDPETINLQSLLIAIELIKSTRKEIRKIFNNKENIYHHEHF